MPVEYDLVIIGATEAARAAAIEAIGLRARVALVLPDTDLHPQRDFYPYALAQIATQHRRDRGRMQSLTSYPWKYAHLAIDRLEERSSPALLAAMGVDTIVGMGEFSRRPQLAYNVGTRSLRAKAYLVATGSVAHYSLIPGIQATGYLTIDRLPSLVDGDIPLKWAIIGAEAIGIELAQTLAKLGAQVTLIVETEQILPHEDSELANLIQAQLEADGVKIYLETLVTNVSQEDGIKVITTGDDSIFVNEIFLALPERPFLEPVNTTPSGIDYTDKGISVDNKLQTSYRQIYACGSVCGNVLGGYHSQALDRYEAKVAVRNALTRRKTKVNFKSYNNLPWAVYTDPPMARVGMTIGAAISSNRHDLTILKQYFKNSNRAILENITSGYFQIIVTQKGLILGAEIVGQNAPELIQILTLAIQQKLKIADLVTLPYLSPSYTEFIYQTAQEWHSQQRERDSRLSWIDRLLWWR
ncbi:FAD-dependent oxidoreductase [Chamaesiphon minutus]|uniref:Pyruvate/2-oxoglutarate dehydrogenase complex, dihydrolipoamide dehydrogenase component n=1 Tax=Chamaesiphon minutus (strain ATCC 27169 / PCC 6605) TaxID=1173020 RepID=K9UPB9_CHAP6|nr:NAD(P)/FAD-dependent oxidoreductase [Chamaesiphon minutus]AFY96256.1 pyruvate/2-oxoglutarate dehydrogenase complex, dihydrolipoamide dehydrogenase component [Chamaesiphon minutus PCC 6605]